MADNSKTDKEVDLQARIEFAVREIVASQNLRQLVRQFLLTTRACPASSVWDINPVQASYNAGFQAAGLAFADILTSVEPSLIPTLMLEELTDDDQPADQ